MFVVRFLTVTMTYILLLPKEGDGKVKTGVWIQLPKDTPATSDLSDFTIIKTSKPKADGKREFGDLVNFTIKKQKNKKGKRDTADVKRNRPIGRKPRRRGSKKRRPRGRNGATITTRKKAYCGIDVTVQLKKKYKFVYPKKSTQQLCVGTFRAAEGVALQFSCKKFKIQDCSREYFAIQDGDGVITVYCGTDKPPSTTYTGILDLQYERDQPKKYRRMKFVCFVKGVQGTTSPSPPPVPPPVPPPAPPPTVEGQFCSQCGAAPPSAGANRIVGGGPASQGEYPWMTQLKFDFGFGGESVCGGSIINSRHILTAAHCIARSGLLAVIVIVGEHDLTTNVEQNRQEYRSEAFIVHPSYDGDDQSQNNDISIVRLSEDIRFSSDVGPVCIAPEGNYENQVAVVTGWGTTRGNDNQGTTLVDVLHEVAVRVWNIQNCAESYAESFITISTNNLQVCASSEGKDSCQGDSGGPLVVNINGKWNQIGLVSFGIGCAEPDHPGVYIVPRSYLSWIEQQVTSGSCP